MGVLKKGTNYNHVLLDLDEDAAINHVGYSPNLTIEKLHKIIQMSLNQLQIYDANGVDDSEINDANASYLRNAQNDK